MVEVHSFDNSHYFLSDKNFPDVNREFKDICNKAANSDDKYVKRYMQKSDGKPLHPRVVVIQGEDFKAGAIRLPGSPEPIIIISEAMLKKYPAIQVANVLRHELGHDYKMTRKMNSAKLHIERRVPFMDLVNKEETRADFFVPRNSNDLRELANFLSTAKDDFEQLEDRMRDSLGIVIKHGLLETFLDDYGSDGRTKIDQLRQSLRNYLADTIGPSIGEDRQKNLRNVKGNSIVARAADKAEKAAKNYVMQKAKNAADPSNTITEDGVPEHIKDRKHWHEWGDTHPPFG